MINSHLKAARVFAQAMDNQFSFLGVRFGIDAIIGIVPWAGDLLSMVLSFYLIWIGIQLGLPTSKLAQMVANILADTVIGGVPFLGDIADVFFKSNLRNLRILEEFATDSPIIIEGEVVS